MPGAALHVRGVGLGSTSAVEIDGLPHAFVAADYESVTIAQTGLAAGSHTVRATTAWGSTSIVTFELLDAPVVTSVSPSSVSTRGGAVAVTGQHLARASAVSIASVTVPFQVVDDTTITLAVPPHVAASGPLVVTSAGGTNAVPPTFVWIAPPPVVTSLSPSFSSTPTPTEVTVKLSLIHI